MKRNSTARRNNDRKLRINNALRIKRLSEERVHNAHKFKALLKLNVSSSTIQRFLREE